MNIPNKKLYKHKKNVLEEVKDTKKSSSPLVRP
jgi:hypothetical protein